MLDELPERIRSKISVNPETGCWEWIGAIQSMGYGSLNPQTWGHALSHRYVFSLLVGPIPEGLQIDHLCRNRSCCNPEHLEPVTAKVNCQRGTAGSVAAKRQKAKTHCPQGHPYDAANTYIQKTGSRWCRECGRVSWRKWYAANRKAEVSV